MRKGLQLWWRGMGELWRSRWLFWVLPALAVPGLLGRSFRMWVYVSGRYVDAPSTVPSWKWASGSDLALKLVRLALSQLNHFEVAFTVSWGLPAVILVAAFVGFALRRVFERRAWVRNAALAALLLVLLGCVSVPQMGRQRADLLLVYSGPFVTLAFQAVVAAIICAGFGQLFLCHVRGEPLDLDRAYDTAADRFFLPFFYFLLFAAPSLMVPEAGARDFRARHPAESWNVVRTAFALLHLGTIPLPFLIVVEGGGLSMAVKRLGQFYRRAWLRVLGLAEAVLVPMVVLVIVWWMFVETYSLVTSGRMELLRSVYILARVFFSLGGVAGMFLLIEDWRTGRKTDSLGDGRQGIGEGEGR